MNGETSERSTLLLLFFGAIALRWAYAIAMWLALGDAGLEGTDSTGYLPMAAEFAAAAMAGSLRGWAWLGPDVSVMPLITWLWALSAIIFGKFALHAFVLLQGVADAGTCLFVYGIARAIRPGFALPAGIAAALNLTQIVLAGLYYTDTFFLFFCAFVLFVWTRWMQSPSLRLALIGGIALGCAAMTRMLIVPWACCLVGLLLLVAIVRRHSFRKCLGQIAVACAITAVSIAPIVARNVIHYHSWALTAQTGAYYAFWVAPLVKQSHDGTPWEKGTGEMRARYAALYPAGSANAFEASRRLTEIGRQAMWEIGAAAVAKTWLFGAVINLGSPAVVLSPPVVGLPRTGFYATPGQTVTQKVFNFLFRSDNSTYALILLTGIAALAVVRLIQVVGTFGALLRVERWPELMLIGSWIVYVLLVAGPIASPKYRLPAEASLSVLTGAGLCLIRERWRRRRQPQAVS